MTQQFNNEKIIQQYNEFKIRQQKILDEQRLMQKLTAEREEEAQHFWTHKRAAENKPRKTKTDHTCEKCALTIKAGSLAVKRVVRVGFGFPEGWHRVTFYRHVKCVEA
jgi:hypothetical protein